ncbi:hypothetical protein Bca52824_007591 [Brassica carinata]|uniref:Uncharacterized protein n=1 Tax=Brassica carinata TaxID=52824 RepID=A0A8X8B812_BRACI|nr:hypothetical protein Bca52824_007591 [Brassica carinata]
MVKIDLGQEYIFSVLTPFGLFPLVFQQQLCEWHLYMDDMSTIIAVKLRKKLGCRMCEKFQLTGMKVTTQQQENNLFKTENITSSIYDPSEASIGWSIAEAANEATDPLQTDDMSTIIAVKLRKKLGCRMCEKFQLTGMKVTTQQQENNLFKTENITSSIYDPSEASIGWSIVMGSYYLIKRGTRSDSVGG